MSMRTIFLVLRGSYKAGAAIALAKKDLKGLSEEQKKVNRESARMITMGNQLLFAGAAFALFGSMVARSFMKVLESSIAGRRVLMEFTRRSTRAFRRLSEALAPIMNQVLNVVATILELATAHPVLTQLAAGFAIFATVAVTLGGAILFFGGAIKLAQGFLMQFTASTVAASTSLNVLQPTLVVNSQGMMTLSTASQTASTSINVLNMSMRTLLTTMGAVVGVFMIVFNLFNAIRNLISGKGGLADWFAILGTILGAIGGFVVGGPVGAIMGGGLGGSLGGMLGSLTVPSFGAGKSFVRQGGLAMLHGGEEITSARESTVTSLLEKETHREVQREGTGLSYTNITIPIQTVNTQASFDDVDQKVRDALREALDNKV